MKSIRYIIPMLLMTFSMLGNAQSNAKKLLSMEAPFHKLPTYFPLDKKGFKRLSSKFGMRRHPILKTNRFHPGLDLAAKKGTHIYAAASGKIIASTYSKVYGNFVIIEHASRYKTLYGHMMKRLVKKNQKVRQGEVIGLVGSTGRSTGPHLHFEILKANKKIDPFKYWMKTLTKRKALLKS